GTSARELCRVRGPLCGRLERPQGAAEDTRRDRAALAAGAGVRARSPSARVLLRGWRRLWPHELARGPAPLCLRSRLALCRHGPARARAHRRTRARTRERLTRYFLSAEMKKGIR